MDPLNAGGSLASIFGAVYSYMSEKQKSEETSYDDFLLSLDAKRYTTLKKEISTNHLLGQGIKLLLKDNHSLLQEKLAVIEASISAVSGKISGLKEVSDALSSSGGMSDQAFSIITQLSNSGQSTILEIKKLRGTDYQILGASKMIEISEPRFVDDDLEQLCGLELLIPDLNDKGHRLFRITRAAVNLVDISDIQ